jgi:hypothetical protein
MDVVVKAAPNITAILAAGFRYQSEADLEWQVGTESPTPPNPDNYGSTSLKITHTYTLKNRGDISSSTINISAAISGEWIFGTNTCSGAGNELASNETCTVQITFVGDTTTSGVHSYTLTATATTGGTTANTLSATKP